MTELEQTIKSLQQKVQLMVKKHQQLKKENSRLKQDFEALQQKQSSTLHDFEIVELQNAILKAGQQQLEEREKKELEHKLLQFVHEIDKCIAVLSR